VAAEQVFDALEQEGPAGDAGCRGRGLAEETPGVANPARSFRQR
jgi:hypothetical protein